MKSFSSRRMSGRINGSTYHLVDMKYNKNWLILLLLLTITLILSGRGCPKRSRDKIRSSGYEWAGIAAPSSLTATAFSSSEIRLSWQDNSNNENGFEIERSIATNTAYSLLATVEQDITSYTDTELSYFIIYYYRVRAFNTIGDRSNWSNEAIGFITPIWSRIACGRAHTLAITNDGFVWTWGYNEFGQLGLGDSNLRTTPSRLTEDIDGRVFNDIDFITGGGNYSIAHKTNNTLWVWGANGSGELGMGDTQSSDWPLSMGTDSDWFEVSTGYAHTLGCKSNGTMYSWGWNSSGQLGLGDSGTGKNRPTPTQIGTASDWIAVSAGESHSLALNSNNTIYSWGKNDYGKLGLGHYDNRLTPTQIGTDSDWVEISVGGYYCLARKTNSTLYSWGRNSSGELGLMDTTSRNTPTQIGTTSDWSEIASGYYYALGRKTDNTIYSWGSNQFGQLGFGESAYSTKPTQIGTDSDWAEVNAGENHSLGRKTDNTIYSWGRNNNGQLGMGDTVDRNVPTRVGE